MWFSFLLMYLLIWGHLGSSLLHNPSLIRTVWMNHIYLILNLWGDILSFSVVYFVGLRLHRITWDAQPNSSILFYFFEPADYITFMGLNSIFFFFFLWSGHATIGYFSLWDVYIWIRCDGGQIAYIAKVESSWVWPKNKDVWSSTRWSQR